MPLSFVCDACSACSATHKELGKQHFFTKALRFMDHISTPAGRVQSPSEAQDRRPTRQEQQQGDALDARIDQAQHLATNSGDAGIAPHFATRAAGIDCASGPRTDASGAAIPTFQFGLNSNPPRSPVAGPASLATTAVSTPARQRHLFPAPAPQRSASTTMSLLVALAKLAAFTVSLLLSSG